MHHRTNRFLRLIPCLAFATLLSCSDRTGPFEPPYDLDALALTAVQFAHVAGSGGVGGSPHFHWLPPIVEPASFSGTFDATLSERVFVEICELSLGVCSGPALETFTATSGVNYWEQIRVSPRRQQYLVYWSTAGALTTTDYRIRVLIDGVRELGHVDVDIVNSTDELGGVDSDRLLGVVGGDWIPIVFRLEVGAGDVVANEVPSLAITAPADGGSVIEGTELTFTGTATDVEDGDLAASIAWSTDALGSFGTGASVPATLPLGTHVVTASVTDADGGSASASITVTVVANEVPSLAITAPADGGSVIEGTELTFTGTATDVEDGDLAASIEWSTDALGSFGTGGSVPVTLPLGTHVVTASVTDSHGGPASGSITVTVVANEVPSLAISAPADGSSVLEGTALTFTGTATDAEDGDLGASIEWSTDALGSFGTGGSVPATLPLGTHVVTASVTDSEGAPASASITVNVVANEVPSVAITAPADGSSVLEATALTFTGTAADTEDGDLTASIAWSTDALGSLGTGASVLATLPVGTHVVTASVTDSDGGPASASITLTVVANEMPSVAITAPADGTSVLEGTALTFTGTAADAEDGDLGASIVWSADALGSLGTGGSVLATLPVGTHVVTASVTDSDGASGSASITVTVVRPNTDPVVTITNPADGAAFQPDDVITLTGSASDAEDGVLTASIEWSSDQDAVLGTGASLLPSLSGGAHVITATVTDSDGATTTDQINVLVGIVGLQQTLTVPFGSAASLPITLAQPAPPGGLTITITSAQTQFVEVQTPTVTVPAGAVAANAVLFGVAPGETTITASTPDLGSDQSTVSVRGELRIDPANVVFTAAFGGGALTVEILSGGSAAIAPPGGLAVTLSAVDPTCVAIPASATIPAGVGGVTVPVEYGGSAVLPCATTVDASAANVDAAQSTVRVDEAPTIELPPTIFVNGLGAGLMAGGNGQLSAGDHGGVILTLTSVDPGALLLARDVLAAGTASIDVPISDGSSDFIFYAHAMEGQVGPTELVATAPGFLDGGVTVDVVQSYVRLTGVPEEREVFGPDSRPSVAIGVLNGSGTALSPQSLRVGSMVEATLTSSGPAIAAFDVGGGTLAPSAVLTPGRNPQNGATVWPDGLLQANMPGTLTISASIPDFAPFNATQVMIVTGSGITGAAPPIGSGLMDRLDGTLSARPREDTPVTLTSTDPTRVLVSASGAPVAAPSATTTVPVNGDLRFNFTVHVLEGVTGTADLTITAPGFAETTVTVDLVTPIFRARVINTNLMDITINTLSTANYMAEVGAPSASFIIDPQQIRTDGVALSATFGSSNAALGGFVSGVDRLTSITLPIQPGRSGVEVGFDPVDAGNTTITGDVSGVTSVGVASGTLTVVAPGINLGSARTVGEGLMQRFTNHLETSPGGPIDVTITSSDPSVVQVGQADYSGVGAAMVVGAGVGISPPTFRYSVHGISQGSATITVSAPDYETTTMVVSTVQPAWDLLDLLPTQQTFDPDDAFRVGVGFVPSGMNFSLQPVRTGAGPLTVTVLNSDPTVGELVTGSERGQSVTVTIPEGQSSSASTVTAGGVAFSPVVNGTTEVTADIPGFIQRPLPREVTVVSPDMQMSVPARVGAGLYTISRGFLNAPNHGGVNVTITSSNPSIMLIGEADGSSPAAAATVFLADGQTRFEYTLQGVAGAVGTNVQVRASAPGFIDGTSFVDVVQPQFNVSGLNLAQTAGSAIDGFEVLLEASSFAFQSVVDPAGLTITLELSDPALAQLTNGTDTARVITFTIPQGSFRTGGVLGLEPLAAGIITLTTTAPGFVTDQRFITINPRVTP